MRGPPPTELGTDALIDFLAEGWGWRIKAAEYAPVGGGSYHWFVDDEAGVRAFVTADDLDLSPWLGETREAAFDTLGRAFESAAALRKAGLAFVVAPIQTADGETVRRFGSRYTVALFPFVSGRAGTFGSYETAERAALLALLPELHRAPRVVASTARTVDLDLPGRSRLEAAMQDLGGTWSGGPFSEPARQALAAHAGDVADLLELLDRLGADVSARRGDWVVTHGEPHAGNLMRTTVGYLLVDWDTVAIGPPERDLWMLARPGSAAAEAYADATGYELDAASLSFFRLMWDLSDIAAFTGLLRSPHQHTEDTLKAYEALGKYVTTRERWAALLD